MPSVRSIALGFWIRAGSRDEGTEQAGISHFLEHLLFKGTDRFSSLEIDELFDAMGAEVNAGTSKETTSVYARFLDVHLERAFDVLQDMVLRPAYPDIDSERQVVIEEIAMYEDEPSDKVHDVLSAAVFGDHPLGPADHRPSRGHLVGPGAADRAVARPAATCPANIVVAAAGNLDHDRIIELVDAAVRRRAARWPTGSRRRRWSPTIRFHAKETEQYHLALGGPGIPRTTSAASRCGSSTRSWAARARRACSRRCARSAGWPTRSTPTRSQYADTGQVALYVGTRPDNVQEAMKVIGDGAEPPRRRTA